VPPVPGRHEPACTRDSTLPARHPTAPSLDTLINRPDPDPIRIGEPSHPAPKPRPKGRTATLHPSRSAAAVHAEVQHETIPQPDALEP
jgi:hypothetical protein